MTAALSIDQSQVSSPDMEGAEYERRQFVNIRSVTPFLNYAVLTTKSEANPAETIYIRVPYSEYLRACAEQNLQPLGVFQGPQQLFLAPTDICEFTSPSDEAVAAAKETASRTVAESHPVQALIEALNQLDESNIGLIRQILSSLKYELKRAIDSTYKDGDQAHPYLLMPAYFAAIQKARSYVINKAAIAEFRFTYSWLDVTQQDQDLVKLIKKVLVNKLSSEGIELIRQLPEGFIVELISKDADARVKFNEGGRIVIKQLTSDRQNTIVELLLSADLAKLSRTTLLRSEAVEAINKIQNAYKSLAWVIEQGARAAAVSCSLNSEV